VRIVGFSVLRNAISIRLESEGAMNLTNEIEDQKRWVRLDDLSFEARVRSISIQKERVHLLLRAKRNRFMMVKVFELMEEGELSLVFETEQERKLLYFLRKVSEKRGEKEEDLLFRLTTFEGRNREVISGKRSLYEISKEQQDVVHHKLVRMLQERPEKEKEPVLSGVEGCLDGSGRF
jgi:hypothetical protein